MKGTRGWREFQCKKEKRAYVSSKRRCHSALAANLTTDGGASSQVINYSGPISDHRKTSARHAGSRARLLATSSVQNTLFPRLRLLRCAEEEERLLFPVKTLLMKGTGKASKLGVNVSFYLLPLTLLLLSCCILNRLCCSQLAIGCNGQRARFSASELPCTRKREGTPNPIGSGVERAELKPTLDSTWTQTLNTLPASG